MPTTTVSQQQQANNKQIAEQLVKELGLSLEVAKKAISIVRRLDSNGMQRSHQKEGVSSFSSTLSSSTISCSPSPMPDLQSATSAAAAATAKRPALDSVVSSHRDRVTNRQKRKRGKNGVNDDSSSDEEDEAASTTASTSKSNTDIINNNNNKLTAMPTTKSGKQQFHRQLCQLLKANGGPMAIEDVEDHFGWSPIIRNEIANSNKIHPELQSYAICHNLNSIIALPSADHWAELDRMMRSSQKLQKIQGQDQKKEWKTYRFLSTEDYTEFVQSIFDAEKGLFPPVPSVEKELRRDYLGCWITNRNGRYWMDRKPEYRTRACHLFSSEEEKEVDQEEEEEQQSITQPQKTFIEKTLTRQRLAEVSQRLHGSEDDDEIDDEVDSIPSCKFSSSTLTTSSNNTVPTIPTVPAEDLDDDDEEKDAESPQQQQVTLAPAVRQFGGKSGPPSMFYKGVRSETGSIVAKGGKGNKTNKKVSFDPDAKIPDTALAPKRKGKYDDEDLPAWAIAPLVFTDY